MGPQRSLYVFEIIVFFRGVRSKRCEVYIVRWRAGCYELKGVGVAILRVWWFAIPFLSRHGNENDTEATPSLCTCLHYAYLHHYLFHRERCANAPVKLTLKGCGYKDPCKRQKSEETRRACHKGVRVQHASVKWKKHGSLSLTEGKGT